MRRLNNCLIKKKYSGIPIWFMRQAGRYLSEFKKIRKNNLNFINLCLNKKLVNEISLQPIKRFDLDAVILFSDILMIPYALGQEVTFKKNFGPILKKFDFNIIPKTTTKNFTEKLNNVYEGLNLIKKNMDYKNKSLIGFAGSPWTLLIYMIHKQSPKKNLNISRVFKDKILIKDLLKELEKFICLHIDKQIEAGANVIQVFDSWAQLIPEKNLEKYCYVPNLNIVNHVKKKGVPIICFPRGIKKENYVDFCNIIKPNAINIDYEIDPKWIIKKLNNIPIQGGMNPNVLLTNKKKIEKEVNKYLNIFKDYPYIFNLGHGILPQTNPKMIEFIIKIIRKKNL